MTTDQTLERLAIAKAAVVKGVTTAKAKRTSTWQAPALDRFAYGTVLAFDQTYSKTGFVVLSHRPSGLKVHRKGKIVEPPLPDLKGFADTIQRSVWMTERIHNLIQETLLEHPTAQIAHEMPAAHGHRIESSLIGAIAIHLACERLPRPKPAMVAKQHVAAVLCPPSDRGGKPAIKRAVNRYIDTSTRDWVEDSRDALAIALTYLYDRKQAS